MAELGRLPPPGPGDEASSDGAAATDGETSRQIGALLWSLADLGRRLGVDPEDALRAAALRFRRQVREVEGAVVAPDAARCRLAATRHVPVDARRAAGASADLPRGPTDHGVAWYTSVSPGEAPREWLREHHRARRRTGGPRLAGQPDGRGGGRPRLRCPRAGHRPLGRVDRHSRGGGAARRRRPLRRQRRPAGRGQRQRRDRRRPGRLDALDQRARRPRPDRSRRHPGQGAGWGPTPSWPPRWPWPRRRRSSSRCPSTGPSAGPTPTSCRCRC